MSSMIRWEPFRDLATLRDQMERVFNALPGRGDEGLTAGAWVPPVDVYESHDAIVLKADLPEMTENDVDISVEGNTLTIKGERKREAEGEERNYFRVERSYGTFTRTFTLPPTVDPAKIEATFSRGVLKISLPKREESKPRQIKVKVQSNGN
jgi:HSP20 family protein